MRRYWAAFAGAFGIVLLAGLCTGCSKSDIRNETVASANGEEIKIGELREFLGLRGGATPASEIPVPRKKEALDRLIAGRLLAQDARSKGLDNTDEFRGLMKENEQGVLITALFRREVWSKLSVSADDIREEAKRLAAADNSLSAEMVNLQAGRASSEKKTRKIEEELIAASRKKYPATIDQAALEKIGKGGAADDAMVVATVASDNVTFGDIRKIMGALSGTAHGGRDLSENPVAIQRLVEREVTGRALAAYSREQGIEGSEWMRGVRRELERSILIDLLAQRQLAKGAEVTDREVRDAYAQHKEMFVRDGKMIPFNKVRDQLRGFLENEKRRTILESYVEELRKKGKITVNEDLLGKV